MTNHEAIYALNPTVVSIAGDVAFDAEGNQVSYDQTAVDKYVADHAYIENRSREYPPMTDYLDGIVKGDQAQIDKYITDCLAVKLKYPKGGS